MFAGKVRGEKKISNILKTILKPKKKQHKYKYYILYSDLNFICTF